MQPEVQHVAAAAGVARPLMAEMCSHVCTLVPMPLTFQVGEKAKSTGPGCQAEQYNTSNPEG
jgi:hypothetical protein